MDWLRAGGSHREFEQFVTDRTGPLLRTAYLMAGNLAEAEDLVQEAMLRVARNWPRVRVMDYPAAYTRQILVNLALDVIIGTVPFLGDAFDIAWKANRRNYALLTRHLEHPRRHHWGDWFFLTGVALVVLAIFALPILFVAWLLDAAFTGRI